MVWEPIGGYAPTPNRPTDASGGRAVGTVYTNVPVNYTSTSPVRWSADGSAMQFLEPLALLANRSWSSFAVATNPSGVTVGVTQIPDRYIYQRPRPVRWDANTTHPTELLGLQAGLSEPDNASVVAINANGVSVGTSNRWSEYRFEGHFAVRWDNNSTTAVQLDALRSRQTPSAEATGISDSGVVIGTSVKYSEASQFLGNRPVWWDSGGTQIHELDVPFTDEVGLAYASPESINRAGTIVGSTQYLDGNDDWVYHATAWQTGQPGVKVLPGVARPDQTETITATKVNEAGLIIGESWLSKNYADDGHQPVCWTDADHVVPLQLLGVNAAGLKDADVRDVNDFGQMVGYSATGLSHRNHAMLWTADGHAVDMNQFIDPRSNWTLSQAYSISNDGWVSGVGLFDPDGPGIYNAYQRLFMIQIPEPSTLGAVVGGIVLVHRRRR